MKLLHITLAASFLFTTVAFAQKDEMKSLKKIHDKIGPSAKDVMEYKELLVKVKPLVANSTEEDKIYFEYYNANIPMLEIELAMTKDLHQNHPSIASKMITPDGIAKLITASQDVLSLEKRNGKQVLTKSIDQDYLAYKPILLNYAIGLGNEKKYSDASSVWYSAFLMDKKDLDKLYYAASFSISANDYDTALKQYNELIKANYTGEGTLYYATNLANNKEENFNSKADRDSFVKLKSHGSPRDEKLPSKLGEIYKNIALIYVSQKKMDEAKKALTEARAKNPDDVSLIITEANLYLETKDEATYKKLITEVLERNPNDADLLYNLGVIATKTNMAEAEKYYLKAIAIDPKYLNAYLNLAIIKLDSEKSIIAQMNKLGTTAADNKKYDVLKVQRQNIFKSAIPYLEKCVELDPTNYEAAKTLLNVYNALEIMDKAKALKAVVKELEANPKK